jgi:hypothetical protein
MNIYLIHEDYEGNANIAFSTQELAEQYLIDTNQEMDIVRVTLDGGYSFDYVELSPATSKHFADLQAEHTKSMAEWRERYNSEIHTACGVVRSACQCYAETNCGEFGGVTKKGTKCLNPVLISNGNPCHLHQ